MKKVIGILILILCISKIGAGAPAPFDIGTDVNNDNPRIFSIDTYNQIVNALIQSGMDEETAIIYANQIWDYYYIKNNIPEIVVSTNLDISTTNTNVVIEIEQGVKNTIVFHIIIQWIDTFKNEMIFSVEFDLEVDIVVSKPEQSNNVEFPIYGVVTGLISGYSFPNGCFGVWPSVGLVYINMFNIWKYEFIYYVGVGIGFVDIVVSKPEQSNNVENSIGALFGVVIPIFDNKMNLLIGIDLGTVVGIMVCLNINI